MLLKMDPEKLRRLYISFSNVCRMMQTRGYVLTPVYLFKNINELVEENLNWIPTASFVQFQQFRDRTGLFQQRLNFSAVFNHPETNDKIFVIFLSSEPGKKVDKDNFGIVNKIIGHNDYADINHLILISENGISPGRSDFLQLGLSRYRIENLLDRFFAYNRIQHALAPISTEIILHEKVPQWAKKERLDYSKLPGIKSDDPLVVWYGAESGTVLRCVIMGQKYDTSLIDRIVI